MSPEYHKMIRNSAKILRRREQNRKTAEKDAKSTAGGEDESDGELESLAARSIVSAPSISGASLKSRGSALSLSKRIHVQK